MWCVDCGDELPAGDPYWKRRCLDCFKASKRLQGIPPPSLTLQELMARYDALSVRLRETEEQLVLARTEMGVIDPTMLKLMISLCHPDKHNNSLQSNEVTRFLLRLWKESANG